MIIKHNRGIALFISIFFSFVLAMGAMTVLLTALNHAYMAEDYVKRTQAIALTEGGIAYAYWNLFTNPTWQANPGEYYNITINDTVDPDYTSFQGRRVRISVSPVNAGGRTISSSIDY